MQNASPDLRDNARQYYGETLRTNADLQTSACCVDGVPTAHKRLLANIEPEILERFYGCGSPLPPALEACTVLDLGCGTGRDVYLAAQLVGPQGRVIGVDMTPEQISVGEKYLDAQMVKFGHAEANVEFRLGQIEDLRSAGIADESIDVVISNCVINLSPDKEAVFSEIFRILKPGGELYFADVFADRRLPDELRNHKVLHGECLGGAMYGEDFRRLMQKLGCPDTRAVSRRVLSVDNAELAALTGNTRFESATIRAFKLPGALEDRCEDYGQVATYLGTAPELPHFFELDDHHKFETGRPMLVCGNSAAMLQETRYRQFFRVSGDRAQHFGLFDCGPSPASANNGDAPATGGCC